MKQSSCTNHIDVFLVLVSNVYVFILYVCTSGIFCEFGGFKKSQLRKRVKIGRVHGNLAGLEHTFDWYIFKETVYEVDGRW